MRPRPLLLLLTALAGPAQAEGPKATPVPTMAPAQAAVPVRSLVEWRTENAAVARAFSRIAPLEEAVARAQNTLAVGGVSGRVACEDPRNLPRRIAVLGRAWQVQLDGVQARVRTLETQADSPLVLPLLERPERAKLEQLSAAIEQSRQRLRTAAAWSRQHAPACAEALGAAIGISRPMEVSAEANTAIIALGPGLLCPDERPLTAEAGVFLIDGDGACISASDSCT